MFSKIQVVSFRRLKIVKNRIVKKGKKYVSNVCERQGNLSAVQTLIEEERLTYRIIHDSRIVIDEDVFDLLLLSFHEKVPHAAIRDMR